MSILPTNYKTVIFYDNKHISEFIVGNSNWNWNLKKKLKNFQIVVELEPFCLLAQAYILRMVPYIYIF